MPKYTKGVLCAGCPHRAAYLAVKEASRSYRNRVFCGNVGCTVVGQMHPAAATCPGGEPELLDRYKRDVPTGGTAQKPAYATCLHFATDDELFAPDAPKRFGQLAAEGATTLFCVLVSSKRRLAHEGIEEAGQRMLDLGIEGVAVLDPFDALVTPGVLGEVLAQPGVHGILFASPCVQLQDKAALGAPVEVDPYMCVGCHRCFQITACPALSFSPPAYHVDPTVCARCDLCCRYCRTQVIYSPRSRMEPADRAAARYAAAGLR